MIKLTDAAKYYKELSHQRKAFEFLQNNIQDDVLREFEHKYRTPDEVPVVTETGERMEIVKILNRIKQLGLSLDKPPASSSPAEYCVNIIGLEGLNANFTLNDDAPNKFNDLFILLGINKDGKFKYLQKSVGTTEPGFHYTYNRMNPKGAARIEIDTKHEKIWKMGYHGSSSRTRHEALQQLGASVCVRRDDNEDFSRVGDKLDCGWHGINFHGGYNNPTNNLGRASAGCQVIQSMREIASAIAHLKRDYYYCRNKDHRFSYIILDASKIWENSSVTPKRERETIPNNDVMTMAINLIVKWECSGNVSKYLKAYADPAHGWRVPTIGIGTIRYKNGNKVRKGDVITENQAYDECAYFIKQKLMPNLSKIPNWNKFKANQKAALISFAYNLGAFYGANGFSTISKHLRNGHLSAVPDAIRLYCRAGGKKLQGLVNRRNDEANMFML